MKDPNGLDPTETAALSSSRLTDVICYK